MTPDFGPKRNIWRAAGRFRASLRCTVAALYVAAATAHAGAEPSAPAPGLVRLRLDGYQGRFANDARFAETFGKLEAHVAEALVEIEERLGLVPDAVGRIEVFVRDAPLGAPTNDRARCLTRVVGGEEVQHVELFAEYFLSGDSQLSTVVTHELVHAVMRQRMGRKEYEHLPHWIREGLAVHVADEGRHHLRRNLIAHQSVEALLTGLMGEERDLRMYPYAWLGVDFLVEHGPAGALRKFVDQLQDGVHPRASIQRLTGLPWEGYLKRLRHFARRKIRAEAEGLEDIDAIRRLYKRGLYYQTRHRCEAFLKNHPSSAFAPSARYYYARCWYKVSRYQEAEPAFTTCIEKDLGRSGWIDECFLFRGICRHELERNEAAVEDLRTFTDLHAYSDQRDLGFLALGRALARVGRLDAAQEAFERVEGVRHARGMHRRAAQRELRELEKARAGEAEEE